MSDITKLKNRLLRDKRKLKTWRAVADKYQVNVKYVYDLAIHGKEPTNNDVRRALGLPAICHECHRRVSEPRPMRTYKKITDLSSSDLLWALEHRETMQ